MSGALWKNSKVSPDGTHHLIDGTPMYGGRFLGVLSFHEPGLAAVRGEGGAWHINPGGEAAYSQIFDRTFGFYENLAAVETASGCFHIKPDGTPAYRNVYRWCGNFQGGRAVVRSEPGYAHILPDGEHLYDNHFLYAGDFRERRASVCLRESGLYAHIDESGAFAHPFRYREAGVFHKGFACAKDERGWMHINMEGIPLYGERFAALEPFYNGKALAKTLGGKMTVIDERGKETGEAAPLAAGCGESGGLFEELSSDMTGYWKTNALAAAVKLQIAEKFPLADDNADDMLNLPANNGRILMRALLELNIVRRDGDSWVLTEKGKYLLPTHPHSLAQAAVVWSDFSESGANFIVKALRGETLPDVFSETAQNKEKLKMLHGMLESYAAHDYELLPGALPLDKIKKLIDAGGGTGVTARLIASAGKDVEITVLDRPEVLAISKLDGKIPKIKTHPRDIFSPWEINGDAVLMCRVLHDWGDEDCLSILKNAHAALPSGGKIFIGEYAGHNAFEDELCSLHLLAIGGGRERTFGEYRALLEAARFKFLSARHLAGRVYFIEGEKQ